MTYHPLMGITIFFIFIIMAFILGNKNYSKKNKLKSTIVVRLNTEKKIKSESISPDASWLE